ncbi:MAG TPA: ABC transporter permease [Vicinamibacterales bacterium]
MNIPAACDSLIQDIRFALRGMRRSPAFTAIAVTTLAVGIGVNAAVFTLTNAVLFKGFRSVDRNDRILYIGTQNNGRGCCVSYPDFVDWRAQAQSFEGLGAVADLQIGVSDGGVAPEHYDATEISANAFALLGQRPIIGRDFTSSDETPGAVHVTILSYRFWERRYERNPAIIGQTLRINGTLTTIVGVMPPGFSFPQNQDVWLPLVRTPDSQKREARQLWFAFGRMRDGVTFERARAELAMIGRRLASAYPRTNEGWVPQPSTFAEFFVGGDAAVIYGSMWGAVGFVLLIACANLANLLLARAIGRSREVSVRIALGAARWRIVRQLLIESVMLSSMGGIAGWWIARWGVRAYDLAANPPTVSWSEHLLDYTMDYRVFTYLVAISIGTGLLFGVAPAVRLLRIDVNAALQDGGRGAGRGRHGTHLSALLVIAETALALVLLAGAGVMIRSFLNISTAKLGVKTANVSTMLVSLPEARYPRADAQVSFFDRLDARLQTIPGVEAIAIASALPAGGSKRVPVELDGAAPLDEQRRPTLSMLTVGPRYFETVGATIVAGREFGEHDGATATPAAIVNQRFASAYWPAEDALGKRLRLFNGKSPNAWLTVVGVVSNIVQNDANRQDVDPLVYVPYRQQPAAAMWVIVRARGAAGNLGNTFRGEIQALDSTLPIWLGPFTLEERLAGMGNYWRVGNDAALFVLFAAIGLLLASLGVYAVVAHSVSRRAQEIGIRIAIGATARDILALVLARGMLPLGIGLAIGLAASLAVNRVLISTLVHVSPADPVTMIVATATLFAAAMLGCLIPARRAMRVDPIVALRHE